ncbi:methyltransferase-like protein 7A isoform X2 [Varanus komodoensis]|uniref:methyltransferase-like protein 7A isoform X2 n=1 Tax=Varanus komodoensis TaxID=61221 RepID=UPI001CF78CBD|nr:methyltransferase-like protein 7A isoform X2 [Varanus komodoensis]
METTWLVVLLRLCVQIFAGPIYLLWYLGIWGPLCKKFFPYFMASVSVDYNKRMFVKKKELFSNLNDFARPAGTLRLLEIGTGTGTNFQFYPTGCRITCTDPNPNFDKFLAESLSQNPHLQVERCLVTPAEDLHEIPDASVDVVVCTLVLCSVKSIEGVVVEVLRVLRPASPLLWKGRQQTAGPLACCCTGHVLGAQREGGSSPTATEACWPLPSEAATAVPEESPFLQLEPPSMPLINWSGVASQDG